MIIKNKTGNRFFSAIGLFFALAVLCGFSRAAFSQSEPCQGVPTAKGAVNGVLLDGPDVCAFLGVPYAAPPLGELRFALPAEHAPWSAPRDAGKLSPQCPQTPSPMTDTDIPMDEDCLYLNVWQPAGAGADKLPVMVFDVDPTLFFVGGHCAFACAVALLRVFFCVFPLAVQFGQSSSGGGWLSPPK